MGTDAASRHPWITTPAGVRVTIRLTPRSRHDRVEGVVELPDGRPAFKAAVTAPPERGKANAALIAMLAKTWVLPKTSVSLTSGATARTKTIEIAGDGRALAARLARWVAEAPRG
ncbi:MAG: DUF167 family protein [Alphaproteobacteria bacterium]